MPRRLITPELDARIRALAASGLSDAQIGQAIGVKGATVCQWRKRHDIPSRWVQPPKRHGTMSGYKWCSCPLCLAANRDHTRAVVANLTRKTAPLANRGAKRWTPAEENTLRTLRTQGMTIEQIALVLGRSWSAVAQRLASVKNRA